MSNWEIARVLATIGTLVVAVFAWRMAVRTYRASFRPVVRAVPARYPNNTIRPDGLILKNIGRGPAVSVFLIEPEPPPGQQWPPGDGPVVTTVDVIEPMGAPRGGGEATRIGRVPLTIPALRLLRRNTTYRLVYQDLIPRWHETTFIISDDNQTMTARMLGPLGWFAIDQLPRDVREQAQIVHDSE